MGEDEIMMKDINEKNEVVNPATFGRYQPPLVIRMSYFRAPGTCGPGDSAGFDHCLNGWYAVGCLSGHTP